MARRGLSAWAVGLAAMALAGLACGGGDEGTGDVSAGPEADALDVTALEGVSWLDALDEADLPGAEVPEDPGAAQEAADTVYQDPIDEEVQPLECLAGAGGSSTLPGVRIEFLATAECVFTLSRAAAGISIPYQVVVDEDVPNVKPAPQDAGHCGKPAWADGLILFEVLEGQGQKYCLCDEGLCAPSEPAAVTLKKGVYPFAFEWDGRNWEGPSDTGNPEGAPFPSGHYTLVVSARGEAKVLGMPVFSEFEVAATFPITLLDDPKEEPPELAPDVPAKDFYIPAPEVTEETATGPESL